MKIIVDVSDDFFPQGGDMLVYNKRMKVWELKQPSVIFKAQDREIKAVETINAQTCAKVVELDQKFTKQISDMASIIKNYIK